MSTFANLDTTIYTLENIEELYTVYYDINHYYHFQYKTLESAENFGDLAKSILDKSCHHTINDIDSYQVLNNKTNLILESKDSKNGNYVIAYTRIPENYRFDIIISPQDGKTLVIYDNAVKDKSNESTDSNNSTDSINQLDLV